LAAGAAPLAAPAALVPAAIASQIAPRPGQPDYPFLSRVVPLSGVRGHVHPLLGERTFTVDIIDQAAVKSAYGWTSLLFLGAAAGAAFFLVRKGRIERLPARLAGSALILALIMSLDLCLPHPLSIAMPLAAINRLLTGFFEIPLAPVCAPLFLLFFFGLAVAAGRPAWLLPFSAAPLLALSHPFVSPDAVSAWSDFRREYGGRRDPAAAEIRRALLSPSYGVINR